MSFFHKKCIHSISATKCTSPKSAFKKKIDKISMMSFFHKKNVTKCLGHHYAIWTSD